MTAYPEGGFDAIGLPAVRDGREPFVGPSGVYAPVVQPCVKLGHFRDFTGTRMYCEETL